MWGWASKHCTLGFISFIPFPLCSKLTSSDSHVYQELLRKQASYYAGVSCCCKQPWPCGWSLAQGCETYQERQCNQQWWANLHHLWRLALSVGFVVPDTALTVTQVDKGSSPSVTIHGLWMLQPLFSIWFYLWPHNKCCSFMAVYIYC